MGLGCRCDSDTFYIYLAHQDNHKEIFEKFDKKMYELSGISGISVRMGIYEHCDKTLSVDELIDRAATACNTCRGKSASTFAVYDEELNEKELFKQRLILEIDKALEEKQFCVFYQPKYNIKGDVPVISSAEALIRWKHPEFGMISPGVFIPLLEKNGLIQKLDRFVWNEAARQIAQWKKDLGVTLPVSVNVSRADISEPRLCENFLDIVSRHGIGKNELMLEITESAYSENNKGIIETVNKLRDNGFKIEMDDFGSGYSSLNMLSSMSIDILKLDMGFVRRILSTLALLIVGLLFIGGKPLLQFIQTALSVVLFVGVMVIALLCIPHLDPKNLLAGPTNAEANPFMGFLTIVMISPWAFVGFDVAALETAHFKFPVRRSAAIVALSIILGGLTYIALTVLTVTDIPAQFTDLNSYINNLGDLKGIVSIPPFFAMQNLLGSFAVSVIVLVASAAIFTGIIGGYRATARMFSTMAEDNIIKARRFCSWMISKSTARLRICFSRAWDSMLRQPKTALRLLKR